MSFPITEIGKVANFINGFPFKPEDWEANGLPIIRIQNLTDSSKPYNLTTRKIPERYTVRKGDVLVSWSATIDVFEWESSDALLNQHIFKVEFDHKKIDKQYFKKALKKTIADLSKYAHGSTMKHVVKKDFESHQIPLPPLDDQIRIAHLLSKVERLIAQRKQHLKQLDELLKSVFLEMFGDPVRNERGWDKVPFSKILAEIESGKSPKCEARQATEDEWGVLKLGSVTSCVYKQEENKALPQDVAPDTRWEVKQGDLLFSRKNTYELVAACAYVFETRSKLLLPDLIFRFVFKDDAEVHPLFIWKLLMAESQRKQVQSLAAGASGSMPNISKANLKQTLLIKPPIELQNEFSGVVGKIEEIKKQYQQSLMGLENFHGVLSQWVFKGELDLSRVILPADIQQPPENMPAKVERITVQETFDKISRITSPIDRITETMRRINPIMSNPAFQVAQRIHELTNLGSISQHLNSFQFASLGETARRVAGFRANLPTMNDDQLNNWSTISSTIANIARPYQSILDLVKQFKSFTEQDWEKLGVEWAFNDYLDEMENEPFTIEKCAVFIEDQLHNEDVEEPFKLLQHHYEHIKTQMFKALDDGRLIQSYHDQENRVCVFRNKEAET